jgi:dTDP-glucose 4,6-dehydratase
MSLTCGKILVTGAGGFIGSHLTEHLVRQGYRVRAFVRYNSAGSRGWLEHSPCSNDIDFFSGDIRDFDSVHCATDGCSMVFHLAALIGIPYSYVSPQAYLRTNIDGGYNVLESSRLRGLEKVIVTSTSEIYGTAQRSPMDETHPLNCHSPYAATKVCADQLALSYHRSFGLPVAIARPFNTYGMRQSARALIPAVVSQVLRADGIVKLGNLYPRRDLTFVEDTVRGFVAIAAGDFLGEAVHIGSGQSTSVGELVERVAKLTGRKVSIVQQEVRCRPKASEVDLLLCDNSKICSRTAWQPVIPLEEGLRRTIVWIENHGSGMRPEAYSV